MQSFWMHILFIYIYMISKYKTDFPLQKAKIKCRNREND